MNSDSTKAGLKCRSQRDGLREAGSVRRRVPVQALLMENHRDPEPAILEKEPLDRIGKLRHASRLLAAARIAGPSHLAQSTLVAKGFFRLREIEISFFVDKRLRLLLPDAQHLRGFLFQRHACEQILCSLGRSRLGVLVDGRFIL